VTTWAGRAFEPEPTARFSPDSGLVATWGRKGGGAKLWQPFGTRKLERLRAGSRGPVAALPLPPSLSRDGRLVATAGADREVDVWSTRDGRRVASLRGSTNFVSSIVFNPAGDLLAAASHDRAVRVWRVSDGRLLLTLGGNNGRVGDIAFGPDGNVLASANEDGSARIWRMPGGEPVRVLREPAGRVTSVAFSADGGTLVTGAGRGTARVWSTRTWRERAVLRPTRLRALVVDASTSRDGRFVATLDLTGTARIWRSDGGPPIRTLKNVATVAFSPSGKQVLAAGGQATVRILRTSDGAEVGLLRGHTGVVADARFSSDGALVVTASEDGSVRVWQAATNGTVVVVTPSRAAVVAAMPAVDGRLVTVGDDGVRLYACDPCLAPARLQALAKDRLAGG